MAANVLSLNYVRPGFAVVEAKPEPKPKTPPKTVRGWIAEATNAVDHARLDNTNPAVQSALEQAYLYTLMAQNMVLKAQVS